MGKFSDALKSVIEGQDFCLDPSEIRIIELALKQFALYEEVGTPKECRLYKKWLS